MTLYYEDGGLRLWHGSNLDLLPTFEDSSFDSIVTDPPYELGFMGKGWDSSGIAYNVDVWRECLRVLKPGGHLLAFGGTRTWHRMAVAIEDAGFEMRDSIAWMYGSGFPKSMDVSKAIDKFGAGEMRRAKLAHFVESRGVNASWLVSRGVADAKSLVDWLVEGHHPSDRNWLLIRDALDVTSDEEAAFERQVVGSRSHGRNSIMGGLRGTGTVRTSDITFAATDAAKEWEGWGTALKPAFEPIVVARKPFRGTVAANVLAHGTGALNIDATRTATSDDLSGGAYAKQGGRAVSGSLNPSGMNKPGATAHGEFEQPSGRWPTNVLLEQSQADALDAQTGVLTSGKLEAHHSRQAKEAGILGAYGSVDGARGYGDSGGASRFFPTFRYEAKAPTSERPNVEGTVHATVKPLELMRWLIRLVTRPGGRVLDPFAGSGTTGEAALLEGMECDLIELEADHLPLILARVRKPLHPAMFGDWDEASA